MKKAAGRLFILTAILLFLGVVFRVPHILEVLRAFPSASQGNRISYSGYILLYTAILGASVWVFRLGLILLRRYK